MPYRNDTTGPSKPAKASPTLVQHIAAAIHAAAQASGSASSGSHVTTAKAAPPDTPIGAGRTAAQRIQTRDATSDPTRYVGEAGAQATDRILSALHDWHPLQPEPQGGGRSILGTIFGHVPVASSVVHGLEDAGSYLGHLGINAGKDIISLPHDLLVGGEELIPAIIDDLKHGRLGVSAKTLGGGESKSADIIKMAFGQSVTNDLLHLRLADALKKFNAHPFDTATEVYGDLGIPGRLAGAAGRSGLLGKTAHDIASTARDDRILAPGVDEHGVPRGVRQRYSKNVITKYVVQKPLEKHPDAYEQIRRLKGQSTARQLKKQIDIFHEGQSAVGEQKIADLVKALAESKPHGDAADAVPHFVMKTIGGKTPDEILTEAENRLQELQTAVKRHEEVSTNPDATPQDLAHYKMSPAVLKANLEHQKDIAALIAHPEITHAAQASADAYTLRQSALEEELHRLELQDPAETTRRKLLPVAQTRMGSAKVAGKGIPTEAKLAAEQAKRELVQAEREFTAAVHAHDVALPTHQVEVQKALRAAERKVKVAEKRAERATGYLTGKYSQARYLGLTPKDLPKSGLGRIVGTGRNTSSALDRLAEAKATTAAEHLALRTEGKKSLAVMEVDLKAQRHAYTTIHKPNINEMYTGHVIHDAEAAPVPRGQYKGQRIRPVTNDDIKEFLAKEGEPGYVRLATPKEPAGLRAALSKTGRGAGTKKYTGEGLQAGAWEPGYSALGKSQLYTQHRINQAEATDALIKQIGIKRPDGKLFGKHEVQEAAAAYEAAHGVEVVPYAAHPVGLTAAQHESVVKLQDAGRLDEAAALSEGYVLRAREGVQPNVDRYVLAPKIQLEQYEKHLGTREVGYKYLLPNAKLSGQNPLGTAVRAFRNTTLATNPRWAFGNLAEHVIRNTLVGNNPAAIVQRERLARNVLSTMEDLGLHDEATRLRTLAAGGAHYGLQHRDNLAVIGARAPKEGIAAVAQGVAHVNERYAQVIFSANRKIESYFQRAVLGKHMTETLQDFTHSWLEANTAQKQYWEKLAQGYADPKLQHDATVYAHEVSGKYNSMSPQMKYFVSRISPYAPWTLNAAKFIWYTMPATHPIATSALNDIERAGQNAWDAQHKDAASLIANQGASLLGIPLSSLTSDIRTGDGGYLNLGRYLPTGLTGSPIDTVTNLIFPEFQGAIHAAFGQDPFGNQLRNPPGGGPVTEGQKGLLAISSLFSAFAGPLAQIHRAVADKGGTAYNTEPIWDWNPKIKPGSQHTGGGIVGGLRRTFNPFQPTYLGPGGGDPSTDEAPTGPGQAPLLTPSAPSGGSGSGPAPGSKPLLTPGGP